MQTINTRMHPPRYYSNIVTQPIDLTNMTEDFAIANTSVPSITSYPYYQTIPYDQSHQGLTCSSYSMSNIVIQSPALYTSPDQPQFRNSSAHPARTTSMSHRRQRLNGRSTAHLGAQASDARVTKTYCEVSQSRRPVQRSKPRKPPSQPLSGRQPTKRRPQRKARTSRKKMQTPASSPSAHSQAGEKRHPCDWPGCSGGGGRPHELERHQAEDHLSALCLNGFCPSLNCKAGPFDIYRKWEGRYGTLNFTDHVIAEHGGSQDLYQHGPSGKTREGQVLDERTMKRYMKDQYQIDLQRAREGFHTIDRQPDEQTTVPEQESYHDLDFDPVNVSNATAQPFSEDELIGFAGIGDYSASGFFSYGAAAQPELSQPSYGLSQSFDFPLAPQYDQSTLWQQPW